MMMLFGPPQTGTTRSSSLVALLLLVSLCWSLANSESDSASPQCDATATTATTTEAPPPPPPICSLYMAPSTVEGAGLGIFTGKSVEEGETVSQYHDSNDDDAWFQDLLIPILDTYKTIPYRGHQRFLSWLGYVWPAEVDAFHHSYEDGQYPALTTAHYSTPEGLNGADQGLYFYYYSSDEKTKIPSDKGQDDDDDVVPLNIFAPGLASLINSHPDGANVALLADESITLNAATGDEDEDDPVLKMDPLVVAQQSPYTKLAPGSGFIAQTDLEAGSELFLFYGDVWHERYDERWDSEHDEATYDQNGHVEYPTLEDILELEGDDLDELPTEQDKRKLEAKMKRKIASTKDKLSQVEEKRRQSVEETLRQKKDAPKTVEQDATSRSDDKTSTSTATTPQVASMARKLDSIQKDTNNEENEEEEEEDETPPIRDIEWLQEHGACLDNLHVDTSTIPNAGRGAFATRLLAKDTVLAPAPLLALKREDLVIYETDEDSDRIQKTINLDKAVGQELLLNYCYGHPESELLLVPYSPVVNFINHNEDPSKINAILRWPSEERAQGFLQRTPNDWLDAHPLDITDQSGKLMMEFVALRDIEAGEEIFVSYGASWQEAWNEHQTASATTDTDTDTAASPFRHEIGVPKGLYPSNWLNQLVDYQIERIETLSVGEVRQLTWKHNGKPVAKNAFVVGLPENFTAHVKDYAQERGIINLYEQLLAETILKSDEWYVFDADQHDAARPEQWFAQRYKSTAWDFNMHYLAAWDDNARQSVWRAYGQGGFDQVLNGIGTYFGLDHLTCFHSSMMGVSEADKSFMHTDVYATGEVGYNIVFPLITVPGSKPELDIQSDNGDVVVAVNYEHDRAILMSDWGYHRTSANDYEEKGQIRVVMGNYCAQIDETNHKIMKHIYHGEDPAPFMDQFDLPLEEIHWDKTGEHRLPR